MALDLDNCVECGKPVHYRGWRSVVIRGDGAHCDRILCSVMRALRKLKSLVLYRDSSSF